MMKRKVRLHIPKYPHGGPHEEQRFTKEDLQNYKNLMKENPEDSTIWNRMFRLYEDKDIIKIMNSVASTGENNQELTQAKYGGIFQYHRGGAVHNKSPHPHKKNSVNHVSFDREAIERKLDNNIAKGTIPMYVDQQGESRVHPRQGVYTQGRKKGSDLSGVYKQPVDYTQIWEDQEDGVKDLFLPPVTVNASAKKWIPKGGLSRTESAGITELINGYQNDEGIHDAIDEKKFSSNGELTREQAYKLIKKDPSLYKKAINKQRSGTPQVKGITKEQSEKNRPTGINTSIYMLDDAYNGIIDPMVQAGKSLFTDPGQLGYIPDAMKAYGQQYMPEIFGKPNYFDVNFYDNAKKGYSAAENVLTVLPADIGKSLLLKKVIKRSGKKLKALKQTPKKRLADKVDQKLLDEAARFEEFKVIAGKAIEDHNRRILAYERSISKPLSAEQTPRLLSKEEVIKRNSQEMYDFYKERATKVGDDYRSFRGNPKLGPNKFDDGGEYGGTQQTGKRKVRISLPSYPHGGPHKSDDWPQDNMDPSGSGLNLDILEINRKLSPDLRGRVPYQYLQDSYLWEQEQMRNRYNAQEMGLVQARYGGLFH